MYACTANSNWNNDTSGPSRYVVWLFPAAGVRGGGGDRRARVASSGAALRSWPSAWPSRRRPSRSRCGEGRWPASDFLEHSPAARFVLDRWPHLYSPAPEVFVERTIGHEGPYTGPVIYRDADGRCRKAWLQWRHARALVAECGPPPGEMARATRDERPSPRRQAPVDLRGLLRWGRTASHAGEATSVGEDVEIQDLTPS